MNRMIGDLTLGVRLAVGGSRKSWVRLALQGVGIGLGVALLLFAASLPTVLDGRSDRVAGREMVTEGSGPAPVDHPPRSPSSRAIFLIASQTSSSDTIIISSASEGS